MTDNITQRDIVRELARRAEAAEAERESLREQLDAALALARIATNDYMDEANRVSALTDALSQIAGRPRETKWRKMAIARAALEGRST